MRRLLRLYPAAWRARYGEEFEALLEEQHASIWTVLDILLGALDAQLERGRGGSTMATRLRTPPALAIIVGSLLWLTSPLAVLHFLPGGRWVAIATTIGLLSVAVGVMGLGLLHERGRSLTMATAVLASVGLIATGAIEVGFLLGVIPWFGADIPVWPPIVADIGLVAQAAFAIAALTWRVLPRLPLVALAAVALALAVGNYPLELGVFGRADVLQWLSALVPAAWLALGIGVLVSRPEAALAA